MSRLLGRLDEIEPGRVTATAGGLVLLLVLGGWLTGALRGSALGGQVAAAVAALLIGAGMLLYAFRLGTSSASE